MADQEQRDADRMERVIAELQRGGRVKVGSGDAHLLREVMVAAELAAAGAPARAGRTVSRRQALAGGAAAAAGLALAGGLGALLERASGAPPDAIRPSPGTWVRVASLSELPEGRPVPVRAGGVRAFLVRQGSDVRGLSAICTHMPCELAAGSDQTLRCPCHNMAFDLQGNPQSREYGGLTPLPAVVVRVRGEAVEVLGA